MTITAKETPREAIVEKGNCPEAGEKNSLKMKNAFIKLNIDEFPVFRKLSVWLWQSICEGL